MFADYITRLWNGGPGEIRTLTAQGLSLSPLPLGYGAVCQDSALKWDPRRDSNSHPDGS